MSEGKEGILFLHQVEEGAADRSYGIEVARLAGLPDVVLRRSFELLQTFEKDGFEIKAENISQPLPQTALKRQILLFSPETDGIIEELSQIDINNLTPIQAMKVLNKFIEKSKKART